VRGGGEGGRGGHFVEAAGEVAAGEFLHGEAEVGGGVGGGLAAEGRGLGGLGGVPSCFLRRSW
jgi:hypothetical protein